MSFGSRVSRRTFVRFSALGAAGAALVACGAQPTAAPATAAPAQATAAGPAPTNTAEVVATKAPAAAGAGTKKIVFSSYTWSGYEAAMNQVIDMWKAQNPGVEVEGQFVGEDYWTKLQTQVASGSPPDAGISDWGRLVSYA